MALNMKLEAGQLSQITVTVDGMLEYQIIQQSAVVPRILTANREWSLEPAKEATLVVQRETYLGVGVHFFHPAFVELPYTQGLKKPESDTHGYLSGL